MRISASSRIMMAPVWLTVRARTATLTPNRPGYSLATCSTSLPKFSPLKSLSRVSGNVSRPTTTTTFSLLFMVPAAQSGRRFVADHPDAVMCRHAISVYAFGMKLHNYFRSSASFRVRIALELKGLSYEYIAVHLGRGDHKKAPFADLSADALVPLLEVDGAKLSQSMAIIEYLDEKHPTPALLPADALGRAKVRALAQSIACEIHPLNNLRVLKYLVRELKVEEEAKNTWYRHWVREGLDAFERQLTQSPASTYCYGDTPTLADCCPVSYTHLTLPT